MVSREKLMERLWETDSFVDENTLTVEHRPSAEKAGRRRSAGVHHHPGGPGLYGGVRAMLTGYLRQRRRTLLAFFLFGGIFAAAFALYSCRCGRWPIPLCCAPPAGGGCC